MARSSLVRSAPLFVALAVAIASADNFADPDLWRHLLVGRMVIHSGHLPLVDTFSYTAYGHLWRQHEWLADTIMGLFYQGLGVPGLKLLKVVCAGATMVFLAVGMAATAAPARVQRVVLVVSALALAPQMQFRPQLFTYAILALLIAVLAADTYRGPAKVWMLIPAFALWANMHGGFVVGLGALGAYCGAAATVDLWRGRGIARARRLLAATFGCALATLVNPLGIGVWLNALHSITDRFVKAAIMEWAPLMQMLAGQLRAWAPGAVIYVIPLLLFLAFALSIAMAPEADDAGMQLVAALFALAALYAVRNMALAVIAIAVPLARHAGLLVTARAGGAEARSSEPDRGFSPALAAVLAVLLAGFGGLFSSRHKTGFECPAGAVAFMRQHQLRGNILCDFGWGEYLIWHLPYSKVFIDGRWELVYPHPVMKEYIDFAQGKDGARRVLDEYPNDFVLISPTSGALGVVERDSNWTVVYRDPIAVLFARAASPAARSAPVIGSRSPAYFP